MINQFSPSTTISGEVEIKNDTGNPVPVNGTVTVNGTVALGAGTNSIGDVNPDGTSSNSFTAVNQTYTIAVSNRQTQVVVITGTFTGSITFQGSVDGTNYVSLSVYDVNAQKFVPSISAPTTVVIGIAGFSSIQWKNGASWGGTANLNARNVSGAWSPSLLPSSKSPLLGYYTGTRLYPVNTILVPPVDVTNYSALTFNPALISTGANLQIQGSSDGGQSYNAISNLTNGVVTTYSPSSNPSYTLIRVIATAAATSGSTQLSVTGTTGNMVQAYLDNYSPSVIPFSTTSLLAAGSVLIGPVSCAGFRSATLSVSSVSTGCFLAVQISPDGSTWTTITVSNQSASYAGVIFYAINVNGIYQFSTMNAMFIQVITTSAFTAGTTTCWLSLSASVGMAIQPVTIVPAAGGGLNGVFSLVTAATNNLTLIRGSTTNIATIWGYTGTGKVNFLKVFNASSTGAVTMGTTSPALNIPLGLGQAVSFNCGPAGIKFSSGVVVAITGGIAALDNTATSAGDSLVNIVYS